MKATDGENEIHARLYCFGLTHVESTHFHFAFFWFFISEMVAIVFKFLILLKY